MIVRRKKEDSRWAIWPLDDLLYIYKLPLLQPLNGNKFKIPKSRYDSVDLYISDHWMNRPEYNDNPLPYDEAIYDRLRAHGTL